MKCPVCGNKIEKDATHCPFCKLSVKKIVASSNMEAKKALRNRQKDRVVMSSFLPFDVNKTKLLLLCIFLGWTGAHCYYVGRMARGFSMIGCLLVGMILVAIPTTWAIHDYVSGIVAGAFAFFCVFTWWLDIIKIASNRFKVPIVLQGCEAPKENNENE